MPRAETVTVYNFHESQPNGEIPQMAAFKATREVIAMLGGELLEGTEEEIPADAVGEDGRYQRVATGWGALA